jgi:hypothetical protein
MESRPRSNHRKETSRLLLLLSVFLVAALTATGLARHSAGENTRRNASVERATPSNVSVENPIPMGTPRGTIAPNQPETTEMLSAENPTVKALSIDQQLDRSSTLPWVKGVLRGVVTGQPTTQTVPQTSYPTLSWTVTDFPLSVKGFLGPAISPYPISVTITLRIVDLTEDVDTGQPGQTFGVATGDELFVYVRDQGEVGGGNRGTILVASSRVDTLTLRNGVVYGHGAWKSLAEPLATFEKHFVH